MPSLATIAAVVVLCAASFALGRHEAASEAGPVQESPCITSWDENDGDSTFCILTDEAAAREKEDFALRCRQSGVTKKILTDGVKVMLSSEFCTR